MCMPAAFHVMSQCLFPGPLIGHTHGQQQFKCSTTHPSTASTGESVTAGLRQKQEGKQGQENNSCQGTGRLHTQTPQLGTDTIYRIIIVLQQTKSWSFPRNFIEILSLAPARPLRTPNATWTRNTWHLFHDSGTGKGNLDINKVHFECQHLGKRSPSN